ncbi:MAG TPA: rhomboid family intramembrane serine protease [Candidatus Saccharimonadia bacterium]|nr:rhomboid family intramembrane serine protease [Candidatus Saccharimonadia bacterium]
MSLFPKSKDHLPLTWWKGHPVYLSAYLAIAGVACMILTAILIAAGAGGGVELLWFSYSGLVGGLRLWTPLTYVLVNPFNLFLLLSAYFFWKFGEDVEKFFGRRIFVQLLVTLVLVTPLVFTIFGLLGVQIGPAYGISGVFFGVLLAFITLNPHAQISLFIATVPAWLLGAMLVGFNVFVHLASRNWAELIMLVSQVLATYGFVRYQQGRWTLPSFGSKLRPQRPARTTRPSDLTVLPPYREDREETERGHRSESAKVDAILEKISQKGMQSLTAAERKLLEQASERLKKG